MKKKDYFDLKSGTYITQKYNSFNSMLEASHIWDQVCTYQIQKNAFHGQHHFLYLNNILLSYATREGSLFYDVLPPKECISIVIIEHSQGEACLGQNKLQGGDIVFFDNIQNFIMHTSMKFSIISIPKMHLRKLNLIQYSPLVLNKKINDRESILSDKMNSILDDFLKSRKNNTLPMDYLKSEAEIFKILSILLQDQEAEETKLTKGEIITLKIRNSLYKHIDKKIDIKFLADKYNISERTLQKSFKSLFGFSPSYFIRALKLNHVFKELRNASSKNTTVTRIASKWGFTHMGRFGTYYKELFGENPSATLLQEHIQSSELEDFCATPTQEI